MLLTTTTRTTSSATEVKVHLIRTALARTAASLALAGLALVSCSDGESGSPSPVTTTTAGAKSTTGATSASSPAGAQSLSDFKPCPVFTSIGSQFGLTEIEEEGSKSCTAEYSDSVTVRLDVHPDKGIADFVPESATELSDISVGSRKARLAKKALTSSSCAVIIEVGPTARVDVFASADASLDEACRAATDVATAVEPKLPE